MTLKNCLILFPTLFPITLSQFHEIIPNSKASLLRSEHFSLVVCSFDLLFGSLAFVVTWTWSQGVERGLGRQLSSWA